MRKYILYFFLAGSLAMVFVMSRSGAPLKTAGTPHGIIDLEFANTPAKIDTVLKYWAPQASMNLTHTATENTFLDFIFIFFYAGFFYLAAKKISRSFAGAFGRTGKLIAKAALLAGFFDVLENTGMLLTLSQQGSATIAMATFICSVIKWTLVAITLGYVLMGGIGSIRAKFSN